MEAEKPSTSDLKSEIVKSLTVDFNDTDYREGYTEEFLNQKIATQIKVLREQREWSQEKLAELSGMKQARISVLEDVNYESWTINVLRRFAKAFDLVLDVEFKEFGEFLVDFETFGRERLEKRSFHEDPAFKKPSSVRLFPTKLKKPVSNPTKGIMTLRMIAEVPDRPSVRDETTINRPIQAENTNVQMLQTRQMRSRR